MSCLKVSSDSAPTLRIRFILHAAIGSIGLAAWIAGSSSLFAAGQQNSPPLKAKIGETLLGPQQPGAIFVSDDGGHMAVQIKKGSREAMLVDGAEGPLFDDVARTSAGGVGFALSVCFSPDGKRVAYLGRRGDHIIPVVDKQASDPVADVSSISAIGLRTATVREVGETGGFFHFSADGSRLAYVSIGSPTAWNMILDGKKGPDYTAIDLDQMVFAGNHLLYVAQAWDGWHLVIDDHPRAASYESVKSLEVSPDGGHYAYIAEKSGKKMIVADRTEGPPHRDIQDLMILSGGQVAYFADGTLMIGDKEITSEAREFTLAASPATPTSKLATPGRKSKRRQLTFPRVALSPDGKRFAYIKAASGGVAAVVDGKEELQYEQISGLQFSPSGSRVVYFGQKGLTTYVVVDGVEMDGQGTVAEFRFSDDGSRFAYTAFKSGAHTVVIDGKESQKFSEIAAGSLTFSPDSKHCAYSASTGYLKCQLVIDGHSTPIAQLGSFTGRGPAVGHAYPPIIFSPDSDHIAYVASLMVRGQARSGVFVDRSPAAPGGACTLPCFSPDSKHFAVAVWVGNRSQIFVDGKAGPVYDEILESNPRVMRFENNRTLRFLGVKGGSVYRVSLDLGA